MASFLQNQQNYALRHRRKPQSVLWLRQRMWYELTLTLTHRICKTQQIWKYRNLRKIKWELSIKNQTQNNGKYDFIGSSAHGTALFLLIWRRVFLYPFLYWIFDKWSLTNCTHSVQFCFDLCLLRWWITHLQIHNFKFWVSDIYFCQKQLDQYLTGGGWGERSKYSDDLWV